jgi:hypothetical protein
MKRDPVAVSVAVLGALVLTGFGVLGLAWRGLAARLVVALQVPWVVSGALGGVALVGFALALIAVQTGRRARAQELADFERVVAAAAGLLAVVRTEQP